MATTTETTITELSPAQAARAARLANKRGNAAAAELASIPGAKEAVNNGTVKRARTVNAVPKPSQKGKTPAGKPLTAAQQKKAEAEAAKQAEIKAQEKAAKQAAADVARENREAARKTREEAKAKRDAERETARAAREEAQKAREEARKPQIMGTEYPSELISVKVADLAALPDLVGAQPSPRFIKSVKEHGVIEPITLVRQNETDTTFRLAGGRRRIMAAVHAQIAEIPAIVYTVGDKIDTYSDGATMHLNILRSENVAADIRAIKSLQGKFTIEQIARETGMPIGTVKKRARLLGLPDNFLQLLYTGKVPHTVLTEASSLTAEQLDALYKVYETTGRITKKDVDAMKRAGRADAADGLDFDSMMDGTPDADDTTTERTGGPIRNTGDLSTDLVTFLRATCRASGITFDVQADGSVSFVRGTQLIEGGWRQGVAPAAPALDDAQDAPGEAEDADGDEDTTGADELDAQNAVADAAVDADNDNAPDDFDPSDEPA